MEKPNTYTSEEVSAILKLSIKSVVKYAREGRIKAQKIGNEWAFTPEAVDAFVRGLTPEEQAPRMKSADAVVFFVPGLVRAMEDLSRTLAAKDYHGAAEKMTAIMTDYLKPMEVLSRENIMK